MRVTRTRSLLSIGMIMLALTACNKPGKSSNNPIPSDSNSPSNSTPSGQGTQAADPAPPPQPIVIPAGTVLTVTIDQSISTKTNSSGDHFAASLAVPVTVNGEQVIPTGARASGTVTTAQSAGHLKGSATLALTLDSVNLNGQSYPLQTSSFEEAS